MQAAAEPLNQGKAIKEAAFSGGYANLSHSTTTSARGLEPPLENTVVGLSNRPTTENTVFARARNPAMLTSEQGTESEE